MIIRARHTYRRFRPEMVALIAFVNLVAALASSQGFARDATTPIKIIAFGDSLTAGFGLHPNDAFPEQLERALVAKGHNVVVMNAGVSGDTTGAGLARLAWAVPDDTDAVILELGANDALRGHAPKQARKNLDKILSNLTDRHIDVLVAGMKAPRSLGKTYTSTFDPIFKDLSQKYGQLHYPFFLDGVALKPKLNLPDGLHPTRAGIAVIVKRILPSVEKLIDRVQQRIAKKS